MSDETPKGRARQAGVAVVSAKPASALRTGVPSTSPSALSGSSPPSIVLPVLPERKYFKIGEVAELVGVEPHVLRYWETQFSQLRPHKARSGHRLYRRREVETLLVIKDLLHIQRFTIAGARQALRQQGTTTLLPRVDSRAPDAVQLSLPPTPSLLQAAQELDDEIDAELDLDNDDDDEEEELELHLAGPLPLAAHETETELEIEARDGADLDDALSEQLTAQLARRGNGQAGVSRVELLQREPTTSSPLALARSTSGRGRGNARVRSILQEAARELEAVVLKLKRQ